jgi:hypothetical protein
MNSPSPNKPWRRRHYALPPDTETDARESK